MTQEDIKIELLKVSGNPELTPAGEQYLEGFSKRAHELMEKQALPLSSVLGLGFMLPSIYYTGANLAGAGRSALEGEGGDAAKHLGLAGLGAASALPFVGGAASSLGHAGLAMQRLAKGRKSPAFRALTGRYTGPEGVPLDKVPFSQRVGKGHSLFRRGLRYPGTKILEGITKVLGPERATQVGKILASRGKQVSEIGPFRFMDRGQWKKGPLPQGFAGMLGSVGPMMMADFALQSATQPAITKLETDLAKPKPLPYALPEAPKPGILSRIRAWDDAQTPSRVYARQVGLIP
jgi:hypothetical protein